MDIRFLLTSATLCCGIWLGCRKGRQKGRMHVFQAARYIHPDSATWESDKCWLTAYSFFMLSALFVAGTPARFLASIGLCAAAYFLPVLFHGMFSSFAHWSLKSPSVMDYPVSVFLRDMRILDAERRSTTGIQKK